MSYKYYPKNSGNSYTLDTLTVNHLTVLRGATINGDLTVTGAINTSSLDITGDINASGNISAGGYVYTPGGLTSNGEDFFTYSHGSWTPAFCFINTPGGGISGKDFPLYPVTHHKQDGYYIREGRTVTVWYDISATIPDNYAYTNYPDYPGYIAITQLPFKFNNSDTPITLSSVGSTTGEWPNGIAFGNLAPAIGVPVYPKPYSVIAYEEGYEVDCIFYDFVRLLTGVWTADGYTALLYGDAQVYTVAATIPPWSLIGTVYCQLSNFHLLLGQSYEVSFKGSFSYVTDDP